jgi:RNA polymerase sigma factor (sigma-70 family)
MTMPNPFAEATDDDSDDVQLVCQASSGDRDSLERLILRHQSWIYNIAVRMVFDPQDAEEVTQEVLIKVVTRLSTFRGDSKFRTWLYRITANHILTMKRRGGETSPHSFSSYADAIHGTPDLDLPDPKSVPVDVPLLVEGFIDAGHVDPHHLLFATPYVQRIRDAAVDTIREIDDVADQSFAAIYRDHPFLEPADQAGWLRRILDRPEVRATLRLN